MEIVTILLILCGLFLIERVAENFGHCFNDGINSDVPCSCKKIGDFRIWGNWECPRHSGKFLEKRRKA